MKKSILLLLIILNFISCKSQNNNSDKNSLKVKIDSLMQTCYNRGLFNGNVLVLKNDKIIYRESLGYADSTKTKPLTQEMIFNIGSISKELSAVSIMQLVEAGKISLGDSVSKYINNLPKWGEQIKIKNLLDYSSGLPRLDWNIVRTDDDVYKSLMNVEKLEAKPNTKFIYSNNNVFLRKLIIEKVTGIHYNTYVDENLLKPLKMKSTFLTPTETNHPLAKGFTTKKSDEIQNAYDKMSGGTFTTVDDMYKWIKGVHSNKLINPTSKNILNTPFTTDYYTETSLGVPNLENGKMDRHQHTGSHIFYESLIDHNLETGLTIILLANTANKKLWNIIHAINDIANDRPFTIPNNSIKTAVEDVFKKDLKEGVAYYYKLKKEYPNNYNFEDENELNQLGYDFLNKGKTKDAIEVFKLLVSEFPNSANGYDSLGEAYFKDGNMPLALKNYQKSLELNPKNNNAEQWITSINYKIRERPKFNQIFTKQQYLEDMEEMAKRLTEKHTNPFEFITKEAFNELVENQKTKIKEGMTYKEFIWELSPIITSIACEHTHLNYFNQEDGMLPVALRFPIEAEIVNDRLLVTNPHINENKVAKGSAITSINGKSISEITKNVFKHIAANGNTLARKNTMFSAYITSYIPYYFKFPTTYTITLENVQQPIQLNQLEEFAYKPLNNTDSFEIIEDQGYAKLRIPFFGAYGGKKLVEFKSFLETSFKALKEKKVNNLIVDLRRNGGGCSCGAIALLKYISKKPFRYFDENSALPGDLSEGGEQHPMKNHFTGKTYVLVDGHVGSTGGHLASVIKINDMAILIGEETGSSYFSNSGMRQHLGTNTAVLYYIASDEVNFTPATQLPKNRGILPDYNVYKTSKDIVEQNDAQLEYTLKLINQQNETNNK